MGVGLLVATEIRICEEAFVAQLTMERSLPCNEGATLFRMRPFIMVALLSFITRVASHVLCEVSVLLELFPANIAWKFSIRIINA